MRKEGGSATFVTAIIIGAVLCAALCPAAWAVDKKQVLDEKLMDGVRAIEAGLDGVLGLAVKDLQTGKTYLINENEVFPQASSIKIALLFEVFKQAEEGKLRLEEFVDLEIRKKVAGSGVLFYMGNPACRYRSATCAS